MTLAPAAIVPDKKASANISADGFASWAIAIVGNNPAAAAKTYPAKEISDINKSVLIVPQIP